jgi:hypothetical protein
MCSHQFGEVFGIYGWLLPLWDTAVLEFELEGSPRRGVSGITVHRTLSLVSLQAIVAESNIRMRTE